MALLDEQYWTERYQHGNTGWDIGYPSTPIKEYIDQLEDKNIKILIPGAGNAYEAEYLWDNGFHNVTIIDLSILPLKDFADRLPYFPQSQLIQQDFFRHDGQYDLIIEQTFFCALNPELRVSYLKKMTELLKPSGKLIGLLFNIPLNDSHPPFGGNREEYLPLFEEYLQINKMEKAYNSIPPRSGSELWIDLSSKSEL